MVKDFNNIEDFKNEVAAKDLILDEDIPDNVNAWKAVFALDTQGEYVGYFDVDSNQGELFDTTQEFTDAMEQSAMPPSETVKEAAPDLVKNTITYLRQNKEKLKNLLKSRDASSLQNELNKIPAGAGPKGSLVSQKVMQWLGGQLNDVALTDSLEKILQGKQGALGVEDNLQDYDADGETDLNKYGTSDMAMLSDQELLECYAEAEEAIEKGDKSAYSEIKACEKELDRRGLGKEKAAKKADGEDYEDYEVGEYSLSQLEPGVFIDTLTPTVMDSDEVVEKVFRNGNWFVLLSNKGEYYGYNPMEDDYFMAYAKGHVPQWVLDQEVEDTQEIKDTGFSEEDKDFLGGIGIQGKKRACIKTPKTAAPQVVAFASEIEEVLKNLILGRVRDVMKKLGTNQETQDIKDIYFQIDEALHKALKLAQTGSKKIVENQSKIKESSVNEVEVIAEKKDKKKKAALEDLDDYVFDIEENLLIEYGVGKLYDMYKNDRDTLATKMIEIAKELFPMGEWASDSESWQYISSRLFDLIKEEGELYVDDKRLLESNPKPAEFTESDKKMLKDMGIQGSFARFNACMEDGGMEHVIEVMAPTEIEGLATVLPEDYNQYPELSSVKDLLVDALVKINEFEANKTASRHDHCENCTGECGHHNHADTADSNTSATVDNTEQGIDSPYAEHDAVYASLDSASLMLEVSKYAASKKEEEFLPEAGGDNVEAAEKCILDCVESDEDLTVADLQNKLIKNKFTTPVIQKALANCLGHEALLALNTKVDDLVK